MPAKSNKPLIDLRVDGKFPKPTIALIESLKARGYTQSDIARMLGVSRQAVSYHVRVYGGQLSPRQTVMEHFPFIMPVEVSGCSPIRRLRDHGEYIATGGIGMSAEKLSRLRSFYKRLENTVIEYDPDIPGEPGVSPAGGIAFRKRRKSDADLLIRVNEYTHLSDQGRMIWRFPPVLP